MFRAEIFLAVLLIWTLNANSSDESAPTTDICQRIAEGAAVAALSSEQLDNVHTVSTLPIPVEEGYETYEIQVIGTKSSDHVVLAIFDITYITPRCTLATMNRTK